jgi:ketosteroid isomerase-like protein
MFRRPTRDIRAQVCDVSKDTSLRRGVMVYLPRYYSLASGGALNVVTISKQHVRDFYDARMSRDPKVIARFLHDEVEWSIAGPVDLIPFCGQWRGKAAAIDVMCRVAPSCITVSKFIIDELLVDGDRAAVFNRITSTQTRTGRTISYQRAEFFVFHDGKILSYRSIMDSFDIAEQVLGHEIDLTPTVQLLQGPKLARA